MARRKPPGSGPVFAPWLVITTLPLRVRRASRDLGSNQPHPLPDIYSSIPACHIDHQQIGDDPWATCLTSRWGDEARARSPLANGHNRGHALSVGSIYGFEGAARGEGQEGGGWSYT